MRLTIRRKMMLFILVPIGFIYFVLMGYDIYTLKKWVTMEIEDRMVELALSYADQFDGFLREAGQIARSTASFIENSPDLSADQIFAQLEANVRPNKLIYGAAMGFEPYQFETGRRLFAPYVHRKKGEMTRMDIGAVGYDYTKPQWEWWHKPKALQQALWIDPYFDKDAGNCLMCTYAAPFYRQGRFWGITTVDIPVEPLRDLVDIELKEGMEFAVVIQKTGNFVFSPEPRQIMKESVFTIIKQQGLKKSAEHIKAISSGKTGLGKLRNNKTKEIEWFFYAPIKSTNWAFMVKIPEKKVVAVVREQIRYGLYIFLAAMIMIIASIWLVSVLISRPVLELEAAAREIAEGNLNVKAIVKSHDEIETLAQTFNTMTKTIQKRLKEFRCFYNISQVSDKAGAKPEDIFRQVVQLIPQGWQYPEITCAKIQLGHKDYHTDNYQSTALRQAEDIYVHGEKRGTVEVCYLEEKTESEEGLFFKEEKDLIRVMAEKLGQVIEREMMENELEGAKITAETASRTKSDFLANMSHELRTPLNAVIGFSEILVDEAFGPLNDKQKEYINDILTSGKHLLSLINDILDLSKVEAGKMELDLSEFDLGLLLQNCLNLIKEKAMKYNLKLSYEAASDLGQIKADERKIKQVVFNILSNAAKFTPDGGKIEIIAKKQNEREALVSIRDTGIGIAEKDKAKVFAEFEQIDSALSRKYAGTGLGMPLSKKLIELHGGKMWFESEGSDKGTAFFFTLPYP